MSAGEHKLEGSELGPLSDETRAHLQSRVNEMNLAFENALARNRKVSVSVIRKDYGSGRVFGAKEAQRRGMIDGIRPIQQTLSAMVAGRSSGARAVVRRPSLAVGTGGGDPDLLRRKLKLKEAEERIAASAGCPAVRCDQAPPSSENVRWYNAMFGRSKRCW